MTPQEKLAHLAYTTWFRAAPLLPSWLEPPDWGQMSEEFKAQWLAVVDAVSKARHEQVMAAITSPRFEPGDIYATDEVPC